MGNFLSSDITSKRKARHVVSLMMNLSCLLNHFSISISMNRREHTHHENLPFTAQNKFFAFVDGIAPNKTGFSATNTCKFISQEIHTIQWDCEAQQLTQGKEKEHLMAMKKDLLDVKQLRVVWHSHQPNIASSHRSSQSSDSLILASFEIVFFECCNLLPLCQIYSLVIHVYKKIDTLKNQI